MNTAEIIYEQAKKLPEKQAQEVLDFLEYLQTKLKKQAHSASQPKDKKINELPGFGMWANRTDISDTNEYLRNLRKPMAATLFPGKKNSNGMSGM